MRTHVNDLKRDKQNSCITTGRWSCCP